MLTNYLITTIRNFARHKSSFLINVSGLSIGLACSILIMLWVFDERSVDKFHDDIDRIYQVMEHQAFSDKINTTVSTPGILAPALKEEVPEFEYTAAYTWDIERVFRFEETSLKSTGIYASPDIFHILTFDVVEGFKDQWLHEPNTIVLSRKTAEKYFGDRQVSGHQLIVNDNAAYTVAGVYDDFPSNSTLKPEFIMPYDDYMKENEWVLDWGNNGPRTIAKLHKDSDPEVVNDKIINFVREKHEHALVELFLYPYTERYLYGRFENRRVVGGRIEYVRMFTVIALFVLLIACINFMNLSTARSSRRAKEVGIRKSIGAGRGSLIAQFLGESVIISFFSLFVALVLVELVLPVFNEITDKEIAVNYNEPVFLLGLAGIVLTTGLIAGSYPALYLSAFEAVQTLKGIIKTTAGELFARRGLVVLQFTLSIILIISTILIYNQIQYVQTKNIGYEQENLITFSLEGEVESWWDRFREQTQIRTGVTAVSRASSRLLFRWSNTYGVRWPGKYPESSPLFEQVSVDYDFTETLGFEILEGRPFSRSFGTDGDKVIVNQAAVNVMGMEDPIGRTITWNQRQVEIIGVVKDFHYQNLRFEVEPLLMAFRPVNATIGFVRVQTDNIQETIAHLEDLHNKVNPAFPFDYSFIDRQYEALYRNEMRVGEITKYFASFSIIISCLGLFGLSAFTAEQRKKEIGIRKVLGATVAGLVGLFSKEFIKLVLIAAAIAAPVAYYFMNAWLEDFAYRITISWWVFAAAGGLALLIALLTVSYQAIRAAMANPVESLRYE